MTSFLRWPLPTALVIALVASCATKSTSPRKSSPHPVHATHAKSTPAPAITPSPAPTPHVQYVATVSVEGGPSTQQVLSGASPSPTPAASTSPTPQPGTSPSPTPKPKSPNFLVGAWHKIFPTKAKPSPSPQASQETFHITTSTDDQSAQASSETTSLVPTPTPMPTEAPPKAARESVFSRMWHVIFPVKQSPPTALAPRWLGTVKLVDQHEGYVLIDSPTYSALATGQTLNSLGNDSQTGTLRVTADREPPFVIADIVSGAPHAGDRVYSPQ